MERNSQRCFHFKQLNMSLKKVVHLFSGLTINFNFLQSNGIRSELFLELPEHLHYLQKVEIYGLSTDSIGNLGRKRIFDTFM